MLATPAQQPRNLPQTARQQTVFARLQALFPASPGTATLPTFSPNDVAFPSPGLHSPRKPPKFLKIRILTWNMHDSLPKGDLEELLGAVPPHRQHKCSPNEVPTFPVMSAESGHPYHLIVVAGQECPSSSGIPMGLGAGIKLGGSDKERDKDKDKSEDKEHHHLHHLPSFKRKDKERDEATRGWKSSDDLPDEIVVNFNPTGWTSMLEHWLCHRTQANSHVHGDSTVGDVTASPKRHSLHRRVTVKESELGPYVPLVKERMMGLYLSIYIHRDLRDLVEGFSKSAVTAGLIGGRVGNKGGVGISLKIDGSTFLFLNAHLAAHEGKVHHRLANLAKIKSELSVDDFLQPGDPRQMREDITDRFDYTFICGDLNFRLDITRLHADWLISRHEYAQAFAFDQLKKQMDTNSAFSGFREAPINFPPTFKFDVMGRSRTKRRRSRRSPIEGNDTEREGGEEDVGEDVEGESRSLASSAWTFHSRGIASEPEPDDEDYFTSFTSNPSVNESRRIALTAAAQKAKAKWRALLLSQSPPASPVAKWLRGRRDAVRARSKSPDILAHPPSPVPSVEDIPSSPIELPSENNDLLELSFKPRVVIPRPSSRGISMKSTPATPLEAPHDDDDVAVYDSSHKQRVPSWCDRILWKSTEATSRHSLADGSPRRRTPDSTIDALPAVSPLRSDGFPEYPPPVPPKDSLPTPPSSTRWRFFPFRRDTSQSVATQESTVSTHTTSRPSKGDIICLSYTSLDDQGMRRLQGRSDHRPVIGSYAVYL